MYMVMLVLDQPDLLDAVLSAWDKAGVSGATILESTGIHRKLRRMIPMRYLLQTSTNKEGHLTLMAVVKTKKLVEACLQATESITGDLDEPNTGIYAAWPLEIVKGVPGQIG